MAARSLTRRGKKKKIRILQQNRVRTLYRSRRIVIIIVAVHKRRGRNLTVRRSFSTPAVCESVSVQHAGPLLVKIIVRENATASASILVTDYAVRLSLRAMDRSPKTSTTARGRSKVIGVPSTLFFFFETK